MEHVITVDQALWGLLVAQILPLLVGFVTDKVASSGLKAFLLMALSAVVTIADEIASVGSFEVKETILRFAALFFAAVLSYFGWQRKTIAPPVQESGLSLGAPR
jgi:hypothetical protein